MAPPWPSLIVAIIMIILMIAMGPPVPIATAAGVVAAATATNGMRRLELVIVAEVDRQVHDTVFELF